MAGADSWKANPMPVLRAHRATYVHRDGRPSRGDRACFEGLPVAATVVSWLVGVRIAATPAAGLLTASGIVGAFLLSMQLQMLDRVGSWSDSPPHPSATTSRIAGLYHQLAANAAYAAVVAVTSAVVLGVLAASSSPWVLRTLSGLAIGLLIHQALIVLMVVRRLFLVTVERAKSSSTGADL